MATSKHLITVALRTWNKATETVTLRRKHSAHDHVWLHAPKRSAGLVTPAAAGLLLLLAAATAASAAAAKSESAAAAKPSATGQQTRLFDGKHLGQWEVIQKYDFKRHGKVEVRDGAIILTSGAPGTGIRWKGKPPRVNYEVALKAKRVKGEDFFCGLTFPVGDKALTLVVGGWGGSVTGLSSIDGEPAVENETCRYVDYQQDRWYRIRVRVTPTRVAVWLDDKKIINFETKNRQLSLYWEVEPCLPLGIATWRTTAAIRAIELRRVEGVEGRGLRVESRGLRVEGEE